LIVSAKMNDINPQAWLAHVLANIAQHRVSRLHELLPWNFQAPNPDGYGKPQIKGSRILRQSNGVFRIENTGSAGRSRAWAG
jgi:hypothetical protein